MKKLLYFSFLIFACLSSCNNVATLSSSNAQQTDCSSLNIERIISESSNAFESSSFANHESSSFVQLENHVSFEKLSINDKENNFFCDSTLNGLHFVGKPRETKVYTFDSFYLDPGWYKISGLPTAFLNAPVLYFPPVFIWPIQSLREARGMPRP